MNEFRLFCVQKKYSFFWSNIVCVFSDKTTLPKNNKRQQSLIYLLNYNGRTSVPYMHIDYEQED